MSYVPVNLPLYVSAYAGAVSGMGFSDRVVSDTVQNDYTGLAMTAAAWAESFDQAWNNASTANTLQLQEAMGMSYGVWSQRAPQAVSDFLFSTTYDSETAALVSAIHAIDAYLTSQGITPPDPGGGGGSGTVTSVSAGPGISITGTPTITPIVNNTGVLSVTAGTNITITGTASNPVINSSNPGGTLTGITAGTGISVTGSAPSPTVSNTGVLTVTAGTNVTITGTSANPVINAAAATVNVASPGFTVPLVGSTVSIPVNESGPIDSPGGFLSVVIGGVANFFGIVSIPDSTHVLVVNLGGNTAIAGTAVTAGTVVTLASPYNPWAGDLLGSSAFNQYVGSLSGAMGFGGKLPTHMQAFQFDANQMAVGMGQDETTSVRGNPILFYSQQSAASSGYQGGDVRAVLGDCDFTAGGFPTFQVAFGSPLMPVFAVGPNNQDGLTGIWLFAPDSNKNVLTEAPIFVAGPSYVQWLSPAGGDFYMQTASGSNILHYDAVHNNWYIGVNVTSPSGQGVFAYATATSAPTRAAPPIGGFDIWGNDTSGNVSVMDSTGTVVAISPKIAGAPADQAQYTQKYTEYGTVAATGGTVTLNVPINPSLIPSTALTTVYRFTAAVKITVAGSGDTVGDGFSEILTAAFGCNGTTVTQLGTTTTSFSGSTASLATSTFALSISGLNVVATLTVNVGTGTLGTAICTITAEELRN